MPFTKNMQIRIQYDNKGWKSPRGNSILLLYAKRRTFLTGTVPNPPGSGRDAPKTRVPMLTSNLKRA